MPKKATKEQKSAFNDKGLLKKFKLSTGELLLSRIMKAMEVTMHLGKSCIAYGLDKISYMEAIGHA